MVAVPVVTALSAPGVASTFEKQLNRFGSGFAIFFLANFFAGMFCICAEQTLDQRALDAAAVATAAACPVAAASMLACFGDMVGFVASAYVFEPKPFTWTA